MISLQIAHCSRANLEMKKLQSLEDIRLLVVSFKDLGEVLILEVDEFHLSLLLNSFFIEVSFEMSGTVLRSANVNGLELHHIAGEGSSFVCKELGNLSQVFIEIGSLDERLDSIVDQILVFRDDEALNELDHFQSHEQRDRDEVPWHS